MEETGRLVENLEVGSVKRGLRVKKTGIATAVGLVAAACLLGVAPAAFAASTPASNTTLNVQASVPVPALPDGAPMFALQQGVQSLAGATGLALPYDYVIVSVNSQPTLYVDPFALYRD